MSSATSPRPFLSPAFSEHMVLQRGKANPIWGWTQPGEVVTVEIGERTSIVQAEEDGKWTAFLTPPPVGGPYTLRISGPENIEFNDVLVGDVWICSGQSNMEMGLSTVENGAAEVAAADFPEIRLFSVKRTVSYAPLDTVTGQWDVCTPESAAKGEFGGFSAVGYFFGRKLHQDLEVPIGLIEAAWGGTSAEAWVREESLAAWGQMPEALAEVAELRDMGSPPLGTRLDGWFWKNDPNFLTPPFSLDFEEAGWTEVPLGSLSGEAPGLTWLRTTFTLPDSLPHSEAELLLGNETEISWAWINGIRVGDSMDARHQIIGIPTGILRPGENQLTLRLLTSPSRINDQPQDRERIIRFKGGETIALPATAKAPPPVAIGEDSEFPTDRNPNPNLATVLNNGMLAALAPRALRGFIWYQGETNVGRAEQYRGLLKTLIADWRDQFDQREIPFYIVSLAAFTARLEEPAESTWAELRDAQAEVAATTPWSGIAITLDVGDADDVHPIKKREVGERLALIALAKEFGRRVEYAGPTFRELEIKGAEVAVHFDHVESGWLVQGDVIEGFALQAPDRTWHWAKARIEDEHLVVTSAEVSEPVAVRYGWASNPAVNLFNGAGLPAAPFRTDNWRNLP